MTIFRLVKPKDINGHDFVEEVPHVLRVYHSTTNDFTVFDSSEKGSIENQFGALNYFTSSEYDVGNAIDRDGIEAVREELGLVSEAMTSARSWPESSWSAASPE